MLCVDAEQPERRLGFGHQHGRAGRQPAAGELAAQGRGAESRDLGPGEPGTIPLKGRIGCLYSCAATTHACQLYRIFPLLDGFVLLHLS